MDLESVMGDGKPAPRGGRFGRFYLQELINSGGMADIWVATDQQGQPFALRRLHDRLKYNFLARRRFNHGCEILAKIHDHDYVVSYIEHGKIEGLLYLLMEYLESSNLKQMMVRQDEILTENVAQILIDSAVALEHVHDRGFMHLDFKPENLLVTRNGGVRLVDFDLAQPKPEKPKKMSKNPGTPAYMAPEQLRRDPIDHRVDIFAYGVAAYEILTGSKPFQGDSAAEILEQQMSGQIITPRNVNPDIPPALDKTILKCLQADPNERYPYMSVVVRDVEAALYV